MPKPATKSELLDDIHRERAGLGQLVASLSAEQIAQPNVVGPWSVKDVLAHLTAWKLLFLGWYAAGLRGETPALPAEGYNWGKLAQLNQQIYEQHRDQPLPEVLAQFEEAYAAVHQLAEGLPDDALFAPGAYAWTGKHALVTYIAPNTSEHYRWARQEIRKGLRAAKP